MIWTVIEYTSGTHGIIQNAFGRLGVPAVLPIVEEYNPKAKKKVLRPALTNKVLVPADEEMIFRATNKIRHLKKIWRSSDGSLQVMSQADLDAFLDRLDRREKKAKSNSGFKNIADLTEQDLFQTWASKFGLSAAIKRFGRDLSNLEVA